MMDKGPKIAWQNEGASIEVLRILEGKSQPVYLEMRQRVADALEIEFNSKGAVWATDSVIEAVFGKDFSDKL